MQSDLKDIQNWITDLNLRVYAVIFVVGETFYGDKLRVSHRVELQLWERQTTTDCIMFI